MVLKKVLWVLFIGCFFLIFQGMEKRKKPVNYYLEYKDERYPISEKGVKLSASLHAQVRDTFMPRRELRQIKQGFIRETDSEIKVILPLAFHLIGIEKNFPTDQSIVAAIKLFIAYIDGKILLADMTPEQLVIVALVADKLVATRDASIRFEPNKDMLYLVLTEISERLTSGKERSLRNFLQHKGLLWEIVRQFTVFLQQDLRNLLAWDHDQPVLVRSDENLTVMKELKSGQLLCGTENGQIIFVDPRDKNKIFATAEGFNSGALRFLEEVKGGDIIFGPDNGRSLMRCHIPESIYHGKSELSSVAVFKYKHHLTVGILLKNGKIAIASRNGNVIIFDPYKSGTESIIELGDIGAITALKELKSGKIIVGSASGKMCLIRFEKNGKQRLLSQILLVRHIDRNQKEQAIDFFQELDFGKVLVVSKTGFVTILEGLELGKVSGRHEQWTDGIYSCEQLPDHSIIVFDYRGMNILNQKTMKLERFGWLGSVGISSCIVLRDGRLVVNMQKWGQKKQTDLRLLSSVPITFEQFILCNALGAFGPVLKDEPKKTVVFLQQLGLAKKTKKNWQDEEEWYIKNIFEDSYLKALFCSLPDGVLKNMAAIKGGRLLRLLIEYLFDEITDAMLDVEYVKKEQDSLEQKLNVVSKFLMLLEVQEKDELMKYFRLLSEHIQKKEAIIFKK